MAKYCSHCSLTFNGLQCNNKRATFQFDLMKDEWREGRLPRGPRGTDWAGGGHRLVTGARLEQAGYLMTPPSTSCLSDLLGCELVKWRKSYSKYSSQAVLQILLVTTAILHHPILSDYFINIQPLIMLPLFYFFNVKLCWEYLWLQHNSI